jgi:hypothetical protein
MYNDFTTQLEHQQREHELTERLERRRVAAERMVQEHGSPLAVIAHLAREGRASRRARSVPARPVGF